MIDIEQLAKLRLELDRIFQKDTAHPLCRDNPVPSAGHCALVSVIVQDTFGGEIVSTYMKHVDGDDLASSHWLNRINGWFIDLTADQFGYPSVRIFKDDLDRYRTRRVQHLDDEAVERLKLFLKRWEDVKTTV